MFDHVVDSNIPPSGPESVAYRLLELIIAREPTKVTKHADWVLNTYAECLLVVRDPAKRAAEAAARRAEEANAQTAGLVERQQVREAERAGDRETERAAR